MIVIPAIDLHAGHCVRLYKGDFKKITTYSKDPAALARHYADSGLTYLHVVDLDGAQHGIPKNQASIESISQSTPMPIQLGGGIRDSNRLEYWLGNGVTRCVIGSLAVTNQQLVKDWLKTFSGDKLVLAMDVHLDSDGIPKLATHGWAKSTEIILWDALETYLECGLENVLCTDISRDGAMSGPNLNLYREFTERYPQIALQASGGVRNIGDLEKTAQTGASAAITGRALLDDKISHEEIRSFQQGA